MREKLKENLVLLMFLTSSVVFIVVSLIASSIMNHSSKVVIEASRLRIQAISETASMLVYADELDEYRLPEDMEKEGYVKLCATLEAFAEKNGLEYAYIMRLDEETNMMQFVAENKLSDFIALSVDEVAREDAPDSALLGTATVTEIGEYSQGWDGLLSAFCPIYYADGTPSNYIAAVDVLDANIQSINARISVFLYLSVISLILVIGVSFACVIIYRRKAKQSNAASNSKSVFLSNMSHEMRTPMNAIIGMSEIAKGSDSPERIDYCLNKIHVSAKHLLGIINDVLDISKIEAGKLQLSDTHFKLAEMLSNTSSVFSILVSQKNQHFDIFVADDVPECLYADRQRITQVITNLLSNAVKFTPDFGEIMLSVLLDEMNENYCVLRFEVKDTGIGISPEQQANLFNAFEQADSSISRRFGGTGLGLAISKRVSEAMSGKIGCLSAPGHGATFYFTVKAGLSDAETVEHVNASRITYGSECLTKVFVGKRILLAEDVEVNSEIICVMLEDTGVEIVCARNGEEALFTFAANPQSFDLILMDIQMPLMGGYEATEKIRALSCPEAKTVPIVAMTANVFREDVERCLKFGMNDHLGKPVDTEELITKMRHYIIHN